MTREQLLIAIAKGALAAAEDISHDSGGPLQAELAASIMVVVGDIGRHMVNTSGNAGALPVLEVVAKEVIRSLEAHRSMTLAMAPLVSTPDERAVDDGA